MKPENPKAMNWKIIWEIPQFLLKLSLKMCPQFTKAEHQNIHSLVVYHWIWSTPCWIINGAFNSFIQNDAILDIDLQASDKIIPTVNRLTSKISFVILLNVCHKVLVMLVLRINGSTNNPLTDIFLYSHHLSTWYCIDIVRRNSVLVTYGS